MVIFLYDSNFNRLFLKLNGLFVTNCLFSLIIVSFFFLRIFFLLISSSSSPSSDQGDFWAQPVEILVYPSPTGYMLTSSGFPLLD